jgi:hypothetical protein
MNTEFQKTSHVVERFLRNINSLIAGVANSNDLEQLKIGCTNEVNRMKDDFLDFLSEIPIEWEPEIFAANTPFTSYLKIKDVVLTTRTSLHYFDRYLQPDFLIYFFGISKEA